jgi:adenylate cyclase
MVVRLHTFLFADLVDFTRFAARCGDEQAADVAVDFQERVRALASALGCETVSTHGDAVLVRSDEVEQALALGSAILGLSAAGELAQVRVGLDTGSASRRGGDWFGTTVNTASRVTAAAGAGELVLSERARDAHASARGVVVRRLGRRRLKGLCAQTLYVAAASVGTAGWRAGTASR